MSALTRQAADVRITEYDLSTTITLNSNATAMLVGVSSKGPLGPTFYSNYDDFAADWGNPNAQVSFDHYMAMKYFEDGNSLWASRAVGAGALYSGLTVKYNSSTMTTTMAAVSGGVANPDSPQWASYVSGGDDALYLITARKGPGSYGNNLAVSIQSTTIDGTGTVTPSTASTGGTLAAASYTYRVAAIGAGGEGLASALATQVVASGSTNTVTLTWAAVPGAIGYYIYGRSGTISRLATVGANVLTYTDIGAATPDGVHTPIILPANLPTPTGIFTLNVFDTSVSSVTPVESFTCSVTEQVDETGSQMEITQRVNPFSKYIKVQSQVFSLVYVPQLKSVTSTSFGGGASGSTPGASDIIAAAQPYLNKELYTIDVIVNAGRATPSVQQAFELIARTRADTVAFLDTPVSQQDSQGAIDYRNLQLNLNSSYASLFCPDLMISDPINGKLLYVPPSGSMAGLYARTSNIAQPWFSIAGLNRGLLNVLGVRRTFDDGQATRLFKAQVNYMRKFVGKGIPLWEQTTLYSANSALQFLNVRFLCNVIKRSMYEYLIYSLQEPGDDILRKQVKFGLEEFLKLVKAARGVKSYRVICDDTNNPAALVNSGILVVTVIIVPILAVREIKLSLIISKEGLTVSEDVIAAAL